MTPDEVAGFRRETAGVANVLRGLRSLVRTSVHYYKTEEEVARFCRDVATLQGS